MKTFSALICLFFLSLQASAEVRVCDTNLDAPMPSLLSPNITAALRQFEAGLMSLPPPAGESLASQVASWYKLKEFRRGAAALAKVVVPLADRAAVCERFVDLSTRYRGANNRPRAFVLLAQDLCGANARDVLARFTANALETAVTQEEPRWIQYITKNSILGPDTWRDLVLANPRDRLPTLTAVIGADWSKLGLSPADIEAFARAGFSQRLSVFQLRRLLRLTDDQIANLTDAMDPLQWLEHIQRLGYASANLTQALKARIQNYMRPTETSDRQGRSEALNLLLDERLDDPTFALVFATLKRNWRKIYGPDARFELPPFDRTQLNAHQLERLRMFNTPKADPFKKTRSAARRAMKPVELLLRGTEFRTMAEFRAAFDLGRRYVTAANTALDQEERERAQTIAKLYAKILRERFEDFRSLGPSAADIQWLSEASLGLPRP